MILTILEQLSSEFNKNDNNIALIPIEQLDHIFKAGKAVIQKEALAKFINNDRTKALTEVAIKEAEDIGLNPDKYKAALTLITHSLFPENIQIVKQIINEYNNGKFNIDDLFSRNAINSLAQLYHNYNEQMPASKLILLNSGEAYEDENGNLTKKKTTFVHALFELPPSKENRESIDIYFKQLARLSHKDLELIQNYLSLSNEDGRSILTILSEKSTAHEAYRGLNEDIHNTHFNLLFRNLNGQVKQIEQVDTHTASIHISVDKSLIKLASIYEEENINILNERSAVINRDEQWNEKVKKHIADLVKKINNIIITDESISDFIKPLNNHNEEIAKFKFRANAVLRLIQGLNEGGYGNKYLVPADIPNTCGLTVKEIIAIGYDSLINLENWNNSEQVNSHFIQFVENLYIAKRGYNIDKYGEDEWKELSSNNLEDQNKCTGGTINQVVMGLKDHKMVKFTVIDSMTIKGPLSIILPDILKTLVDPEDKKLITSWVSTGIINSILSDKIIVILKEDRKFKEEFSSSDITNFVPAALNKFSNAALIEILLKSNPEILTDLKHENNLKDLLNTFAFNQERGYVLYLEDLYTKKSYAFNQALQSILNIGITVNTNSADTIKYTLLLDLLFSSLDQEMVESTLEVFKVHFQTSITEEIKNQYLILAVENGYKALLIKLIEAGADVNAKDNRNGHLSLTAFEIAIKVGNLTIIKYLIENCSEIIDNIRGALKMAIRYSNLKSAKYIIKNFPDLIDTYDDNGHSVLRQVITSSTRIYQNQFFERARKLEIVKYLIEKLPNIKITDTDGSTALHWFISNEHREITSYIIEKFPNLINTLNNEDKSRLLLDAARYKNLEMIKHIIEKFPNLINTLNNEYKSSLLLKATQDKNLEMVKYIIEKFSNLINILNNEDKSRLLLDAARYKNLEMIKHIIEKFPNLINTLNNEDKSSLLLKAAQDKNLEMVKYIIEKFPDLINIVNKKGHSFLRNIILGSSYSNDEKIELVNYLIKKFPNIKISDNDGSTILHWAAESGLYKLIKNTIIKKFPNLINNIDNDGNTVLHCAVHDNNKRLILLILEEDKDQNIINAVNNNGETACLLAAKCLSGTPNLLSLLASQEGSKTFDINKSDKNGNNILHLILYNNVEQNNLKFSTIEQITNLLARMGFDFVKENNEGYTPFELVKINFSKGKRKQNIETLLKKSEDEFKANLELKKLTFLKDSWDAAADITSIKNILEQNNNVINRVDSGGNTILHRIVSEGALDTKELEGFVGFLIAKGINLNLKNKDGKTALEIAQVNHKYGNEFDATFIEILENIQSDSVGSEMDIAPDNNQASSSSSSSSSKRTITEMNSLNIESTFKNNCIQPEISANDGSSLLKRSSTSENQPSSKKQKVNDHSEISEIDEPTYTTEQVETEEFIIYRAEIINDNISNNYADLFGKEKSFLSPMAQPVSKFNINIENLYLLTAPSTDLDEEVSHLTEFFQAIDNNNLDQINQLISAYPGLVNTTSSDGNSAVFMATIYGHTQALQMLLAQGAYAPEYNQREEISENTILDDILNINLPEIHHDLRSNYEIEDINFNIPSSSSMLMGAFLSLFCVSKSFIIMHD